jgi:propionyl-CoA carboxylase alpha chain
LKSAKKTTLFYWSKVESKIMGSKLAAKDAVKQYNIPMVPGFDEAIHDVEKQS